ncbi:uncharacterized protein LOC133350604 isoform X3 [Lethenteron reissneri]|uniref:uncharacterized protein LOC133350604 isoform X3 n=1 Tax=Lethenteron reissneri TaxID=7753 RepID=UPI002AB7A2F2|nr:uncharacterized protein LOC133350604 isoform X3 [Lethenteron reissneri]
MISNNNCHYVDRSDCSRPFQLSPPLSTMELADLLLQEVDALLVGAACRVTLLPRLLRDDKEELVASIEKDIGDARELLEQLELAGWEMDAKRRKRHQELVKTKGEAVTQLQKDYWRARISYRDVVSPWNEVLEEGAEEANLSEDLIFAELCTGSCLGSVHPLRRRTVHLPRPAQTQPRRPPTALHRRARRVHALPHHMKRPRSRLRGVGYPVLGIVGLATSLRGWGGGGMCSVS